MRFQKPTIQRTFWKAFIFISIFDRFSVDARGENASKNILFHTNADNCCRGLSQWAHDSSRPDEANVTPQTESTSTWPGTHLFMSAILMLDQDGGFDLLLLLMASCLTTERKRTQVNGGKTQRGVREQQQERGGIFHLVISVSILDNLGCFIKLPLLTICK